jgi:hypothetical protein
LSESLFVLAEGLYSSTTALVLWNGDRFPFAADRFVFVDVRRQQTKANASSAAARRRRGEDR